MSKKTLKLLKAGLVKLKKQVATHKNVLISRLAKKEDIPDEDEQWLDHEANLVDEEIIVDLLKNASDYERGLERLNSQQKTLVEKIADLAGGIKDLQNKKRKHAHFGWLLRYIH